MKKCFVILAMVLLSVPSRGGEGTGNLKALAPFLDEQVFAVARFDLDADAVFGKLKEIGFPPRDLEQIKKLAGKWREEITQAGGKEIFLVWSLVDELGIPFVLIPTKGEEEAKTLADALKQSVSPAAIAKGSITLVGNANALMRLSNVQAKPRPELARAFAAVKNMPIQAALIPPPILRRSLVESYPNLPKEIGGGPSRTIDQGFRFAAAGAQISPKVSLRLVIQAKDADAAKELDRVLEKALQGLVMAKQGAGEFPELKVILPLLTPKLQEDRVVLTIDDQTYTKIIVPMAARVRNAAQRNQDANNLKQIALAMHNYLDTHKTFPSSSSFDKQGKPLLSWRVHILPYVEQDHLYKQFKLEEPWDSEHNKKLIAKMPAVYKSPFQKKAAAGKTTYLVPVGKDTIFPGPKGIHIRDITDGTSNTILVVEVNDDNAVTWTKPDDFKVSTKDPLAKLLRPESKGFNAAFADGSVRYLPRTIALKTLRALFTRNGGEVIELP